ncbi:uncharacterized protein [Zea mays]|uniref:uncharacterized protein n=1 Tax=Zea mays TaxID=4577 RepID=UPI001652D251|nr:uncharacterized protein LOC103636008 [Zea mays]
MRKQPCIDVILGRHFSMPTQRMENSSDCDSNTHQTSALETPARNVLSPLSLRAEKPATPLSQDIGQNSQGEQVAEIETSEELKMEMSPNSAQDKNMDSLEKAMNRAAARNLDVKGGSSIAAGFKQYNTSPCPGPHAAGYFHYYPLATVLGCTAEARSTVYCDGSFTTFGAGGYEVLISGAWVTF